MVASHTMASLSSDAVKIHRPSGLKVAEQTALVCPSSTTSSFPLSASQRMAVLSRDAVTIR